MRSLLFVPADDERKQLKALTTNTDIIVLDLEDSITSDRKQAARESAKNYLLDNPRRSRQKRFYVRINDLRTPFWEQDLEAIVETKPDGILLPKARSGRDVDQLCRVISDLEIKNSLNSEQIDVMALITETPDAMLSMPSFLNCAPRLKAMTWGAEDLSAEIGAKTNRDESGNYTATFELARTLTLLTARAAGCEPVDTVFTDFRDSEGLRADCYNASRDGFTAKFAIHPDQVDIINEAFTPSDDEIGRAQAIVDAFSRGADKGEQVGVTSLDGQMLDRPHLIQARQILNRAQQIKS